MTQVSLDGLKMGDRVTVLIPNGIGRNGVEWKEATGKAVFKGTYGWVLNMGGKYGKPGLATERNFVRATRKAVKA